MIEEEVRKYLDKGGFLSDAIDEFEHRPQQIAMAEAVGRVFDSEHHLIVEAGTGTGKSLAYLIPAILWAVQHNKKVVVSTYSKALQEQLLYHDIPLIHEKLKIPFRYALCLGHILNLSETGYCPAGSGIGESQPTTHVYPILTLPSRH